jgi:hypothetical protein
MTYKIDQNVGGFSGFEKVNEAILSELKNESREKKYLD